MKNSTKEKIHSFFAQNPFFVSENPFIPTDAEITIAERRLNVRFDEDFKDLIKSFGGGYFGITIYELRKGNENIIELTEYFRKDGLREANDKYVISLDGSGNPIMINKNGEVVLYDHNCGTIDILASSFENFILESLY